MDDVDAGQVRIAVDSEFEAGVQRLGFSRPGNAPSVDHPAGGALIDGQRADVPAVGLGVEHRDAFKGAFVTAVIVGTVVNYVVGVAMFVVVAHSTIAVGITARVLPFIPTAIIKAVLACAIGLNLRKRIPGLKA